MSNLDWIRQSTRRVFSIYKYNLMKFCKKKSVHLYKLAPVHSGWNVIIEKNKIGRIVEVLCCAPDQPARFPEASPEDENVVWGDALQGLAGALQILGIVAYN